jgi:ABC-2 type transport system ATP-binding protein
MAWVIQSSSDSVAPRPAVLRVDGLSKHFGDKQAVVGLSCQVDPGVIMGLIGPNGAGKTTTIKLILGLLLPSAGRAEVSGLDCTSESLRVRELVGYVPDEPAFYEFLSGRETLDFACEIRGLDRHSAWDRLEALSARLEFSQDLDQLVGGYSHGMKKKLALLLALAHAPRLLLLDEPTNGLDPPSARLVRELLSSQVADGVGILLSTHLLEMADRVCHSLMFLNKGHLIAAGTPLELRGRAGLGTDASLEDAFLRLITAP